MHDRDQAVHLRPDLAEAYLARGGSYHQLGMHAEGLKDRSEAIRLNPNLPEAWFARGSAYYLLGDYAKALSDIEQAVRLRPGYEEALMVLRKTQGRLGEREQSKVPKVVQASVQASVQAAGGTRRRRVRRQ